MLSLRRQPQSTERPAAPTESAPPVSVSPQLRHSHRPLPGGGRIFVTLSDGTPVGVIRYDLEQKDGMPLLLRAFANVTEERLNKA